MYLYQSHQVKSSDLWGVVVQENYLINVMLGLLESFDGNILINGENVGGNSSIIRKNVAYLPQQIFLTDDSLRNNIALGENPNEISDEKIFEVLSKVRLSEFVKGLPHGLDTLIGEKGMRLSGGQCQRVALARSLYYERSLLVLDEATSALDVDTEKLIIDELKELKGEKDYCDDCTSIIFLKIL